jgi:hypothetical protein
MKGRTFSSQNKMSVGGVTKMQAGRVVPTQAPAPRTPSRAKNAPFVALANRMKAKLPPKTPAAPKPAMPLPPSGFRKGGSTKRKMSKKY